MDAITRSLMPGEKVRYRARYHWWFNLRSLGLLNAFDKLVITDRRILSKTGIIASRTHSVTLTRIEAKDVEQSVWGRVFGFGDVLIHGVGGTTTRYANLARPTEFARAIGFDSVGGRPDETKPRPARGTQRKARSDNKARQHP